MIMGNSLKQFKKDKTKIKATSSSLKIQDTIHLKQVQSETEGFIITDLILPNRIKMFSVKDHQVFEIKCPSSKISTASRDMQQKPDKFDKVQIYQPNNWV